MAQRLAARLREALLFPVDDGNLAMRADQLRTRLRMYPTMLGGQSLLVAVFAWLMWDAVPHDTLLTWCAASYVVYSVDMLGWYLYRDRLNSVRDCNRWHAAFSLFTAAGGLLWGGFALWMFPADPTHQAEIIMVILGLSAASVTTNPSYPSSFYIYALCVVLPLAVRFMMSDSDESWAMALIVILYLAVVLKVGAEFGRSFTVALQQRHENMQLIGKLSEQKVLAEQAQQQAEAASNEKSRFLAAASHDLRQPLQSLVLFSDALTGQASNHETRRLARQIEKSVHALSDMFDELLDLSRLEAGMLQPRLQHFSLSLLLDRLYVNFAPLAQAKGLGFDVSTGRSSSTVGIVLHTDPFLLERILHNLLTNAIRYTDDGEVVLRCTQSEAGVTFEVVDTGIGIPQENIPHIFEEYYQADNFNRDRRKGLGLGLAIVRRIERLLGTRIEVRSGLGEGSSFSFSMPLGDADLLSQPFGMMPASHDLTGAVVALVEDDPDIRHMSEKMMEQWGCQVVAGELPGEVIRGVEARKLRPGLLVCDYRLPQGVTAMHAISEMRAKWGEKTPALVVTGDTAPEVLQEIQNTGAMLLHKPVTPVRLRAMMHMAIYGG